MVLPPCLIAFAIRTLRSYAYKKWAQRGNRNSADAAKQNIPCPVCESTVADIRLLEKLMLLPNESAEQYRARCVEVLSEQQPSATPGRCEVKVRRSRLVMLHPIAPLVEGIGKEKNKRKGDGGGCGMLSCFRLGKGKGKDLVVTVEKKVGGMLEKMNKTREGEVMKPGGNVRPVTGIGKEGK